MNFVLQFIKNHFFAILLSLTVGILYISPQLFFQLELGENYHGIYLAGTDNEEYYSGRIREIFDGHYFAGNPFLYEERNDIFFQPPLGELVFLPLKIIFSDTSSIVWGTRFIFPIILFLIIYVFFYLVIKNKFIASAIGVFILLGSQIAYSPKELINFIQLKFSNLNNISFLTYSRPVIPEISSMVFFLFLIFLYFSITKPERKFPYIAGILFGASIYIYIYSWLYILTLSMLFFVFYFIKKERMMIARIIRIGITGLVVSLPYWIIFYFTIHGLNYMATAERYNLYASRQFVFSKIVFASLILLLLAYYKQEKNNFYYFSLLLLATGFIVINQQIITGKILFLGHFHWYFNVPIGIAVLTYSLFRIVYRNLKVFSYCFLFFILIINFGYAIVVQKNSYYFMYPKYSQMQTWGKIFSRLDKEYENEEVILSNNRNFSINVSTYTHHYPYDGIYSHLNNTNPKRLLYNIFLLAWMRGVEAGAEENFYNATKADLSRFTGGARNKRLYGCMECLSNEEKSSFANQYKNFIEKKEYEKMNASRLDILVWDDKLNSTMPEYLQQKISLLWEVDNLKIYKFSF
ncbi:MAG: hypothetical protein US74_C0001G0036 [Parcubacteria group bacterium GW2011_GWA2_38_13]|nr:MAG: hypothetical protein US74_C0001G0036 [Parcubacteria group bacterium GW2011_GWA2_38_13]